MDTAGMYGPLKPRTPAYGMTIVANVKPGKADEIRANAAKQAELPLHDLLKPLTLHYARWVLINNDTQFVYIAIFDTAFDTYVEDAVRIFQSIGMGTLFLSLEGFPEDGMTNVPAFVQFVREHQVDSFLEFSSYPGVTVAEIEKGLKVRQAFSDMLDQMQ
jgi:hypothetical protein